jgi:HSP20 family molecular chaperone IbpA
MFNEFPSEALVNDLLEEMWVEAMFAQIPAFIPVTEPAVNIDKTESSIDIQMSLPGLSRSDIDVTVENGVLTVSTADCRGEDYRGENASSVTAWTSHGTTSAWALPVGVQIHQITTRYVAGVLEVSIPFETTGLLTIPVE